MKSAYEIAWDLIYARKVDLTLSEIATLTGISESKIDLLKIKKDIVRGLPEKKHLDLAKQVIEEIQQGKPHWQIRQPFEHPHHVKMTVQSRVHEQDEQGVVLDTEDSDVEAVWKKLRSLVKEGESITLIRKQGIQNDAL